MLAAAILLLALPLLVADRLRRLSWFEAALAWVVRVTLVGLFFGFILPDAWEHAGAWSLLTAALGALVPTLAERAGLAEGRVEGVNLLVGQAGLLLHAGFDGMAIATSPGFSAMAVSVLVHQLLAMALALVILFVLPRDRKSTRLNSSHSSVSRMPSSA